MCAIPNMAVFCSSLILWFSVKKVKFRLKTSHGGPDGKKLYSSTLSLTSDLDRGGWLTPRPGRFTPPPPKDTRYPSYRWLGGPQGWSGRVRKILPLPELFFGSFFVFCRHLFVLIVLAICLVFLLYKAKQKHPCHRRDSNQQSQQAIGHRPSP